MPYYSVHVKYALKRFFTVVAPDTASAEKLVDYLVHNDCSFNDMNSFKRTDQAINVYSASAPGYDAPVYNLEDYRDKVYPRKELSLCPTQEVDSCFNCKYGLYSWCAATPVVLCKQDDPSKYATGEERERLYNAMLREILPERDREWLELSDSDSIDASPRIRCFCRPEKCEKFEAIK